MHGKNLTILPPFNRQPPIFKLSSIEPWFFKHLYLLFVLEWRCYLAPLGLCGILIIISYFSSSFSISRFDKIEVYTSYNVQYLFLLLFSWILLLSFLYIGQIIPCVSLIFSCILPRLFYSYLWNFCTYFFFDFEYFWWPSIPSISWFVINSKFKVLLCSSAVSIFFLFHFYHRIKYIKYHFQLSMVILGGVVRGPLYIFFL